MSGKGYLVIGYPPRGRSGGMQEFGVDDVARTASGACLATSFLERSDGRLRTSRQSLRKQYKEEPNVKKNKIKKMKEGRRR